VSDDEELTAEPERLSTQQVCAFDEPRRIIVKKGRRIRSVAEETGESGKLVRRLLRGIRSEQAELRSEVHLASRDDGIRISPTRGRPGLLCLPRDARP